MNRKNWEEAILPGIVVVYLILYLAQTYDLPFQTILYPFLLITLLVVLLIIFGVQQLVLQRKGDSSESVQPPTDGEGTAFMSQVLKIIYIQRRAFGVVLLTFLFPHVVAHLGFFFTASLYLSALFMVFRTVQPIFILILAPLISGMLTWVLLGVVQLNFPRFDYAELPWYF